MKRAVRAALIAMAATAPLAMTFCGGAPAGMPGLPIVGGAPGPQAPAAPALDPYLEPVLLDPHGRPIRLADFKGRVRIFDIWATWCRPCRMGIPHLNKVYDRYRDRGLVIVGISVDDDPAEVLEFATRIPLRYPNGMGNPVTERLFGATRAVPTTFVVDREGRVRRQWEVMVDAAMLEAAIADLL